MYTTLSPCDMCTGACILYKVTRVVMGENANFVGGEKYLKERGIEVVNLEDEEMKGIMGKFIKEHPDIWASIFFALLSLAFADVARSMRILVRNEEVLW